MIFNAVHGTVVHRCAFFQQEDVVKKRDNFRGWLQERGDAGPASLLRPLLQTRDNVISDRGIEASGDFIHTQDLGVFNQRLGDRDSLFLPTRDAPNQVISNNRILATIQVQQLYHLVNLLFVSSLPDIVVRHFARVFMRKFNRLLHREERKVFVELSHVLAETVQRYALLFELFLGETRILNLSLNWDWVNTRDGFEQG